METFGVVFNACYGGLVYSDDFVDEYNRRFGGVKRLANWCGLGEGGEARTDLDVIALLQEKGSEWSSGRSSKLQMAWLPVFFRDAWAVQEYDGLEKVVIDHAACYRRMVHDYAKLADPDPRLLASLAELQTQLRNCQIAITTEEAAESLA